MDATRGEDDRRGDGRLAVPVVRLHEVTESEDERSGQAVQTLLKLPTTRRSTAPGSPSAASTDCQGSAPVYQVRSTPPWSSCHSGPRALVHSQAPAMSRAKSMPSVHISTCLTSTLVERPNSPAGVLPRHRPMRRPLDDVFPGLASQPLGHVDADSIPEDEESHAIPSESRSSSPPYGLSAGMACPGQHRPSSPLRWTSMPVAGSGAFSVSSSGMFMPQPTSHSMRFSEIAFASSGSTYASSSIPSTPTSIRSRSPSISSLETIPDTPDAEEAALEVERMAQLKTAVDAADQQVTHAEARKNNTLDNSCNRGRTPAYNARDKRKRWSICGGERRGDLDLETIPED